MSQQYVSKFSGVNIDRAVAYYNGIQNVGRTILKVNVATSDWNSTSGATDASIANYRLYITMTGVSTTSGEAFSEPPILYFLSDGGYEDGSETTGTKSEWAGLKWDLEYRCSLGLNNSYSVVCYSNLKMSGTMVITAILSNINDGTIPSGDLRIRGNLVVDGSITQPDISNDMNT